MDREGGYARCSACFLEIYGDLIMFAIHLVRRLFAYFHGVLSAYTKYEVTFRLQPRFRYAYSLKRRREARGKVALSCSRLQSHVTVLFLCVFFSFAGPIIRDPGLHVQYVYLVENVIRQIPYRGKTWMGLHADFCRYMPCLPHPFDCRIGFNREKSKDIKDIGRKGGKHTLQLL